MFRKFETLLHFQGSCTIKAPVFANSMLVSPHGKGSMPTNNTVLKAHLFPRIGIIPVLIALGYGACVFMFGGALAIILLNDGFFDPSLSKIMYLSDGMVKHQGISILGFGTCYNLLFGILMVVSWVLGNVILFCISILNVFAFQGVLAYAQLNGPEHVSFVIILLITHAMIHHITANSELGFLWYRYTTGTSTVFLFFFVIFWFLGEKVVHVQGLQVTAFIFELFLWCFACAEFACMVSMLHYRHSHGAGNADDVSRIPLLKRDLCALPSAPEAPINSYDSIFGSSLSRAEKGGGEKDSRKSASWSLIQGLKRDHAERTPLPGERPPATNPLSDENSPLSRLLQTQSAPSQPPDSLTSNVSLMLLPESRCGVWGA